MSKRLLVLALILVTIVTAGFFFANSSADQKKQEATLTQNGFKGHISPKIFNEKLSSGTYVVLDVRTPEEYNAQRIHQDAVLVNFYDANFKEQLNALPKDTKYLLHCRSGNRSSKTIPTMEELGFEHFYELEVGINGWIREGFETI